MLVVVWLGSSSWHFVQARDRWEARRKWVVLASFGPTVHGSQPPPQARQGDICKEVYVVVGHGQGEVNEVWVATPSKMARTGEDDGVAFFACFFSSLKPLQALPVSLFRRTLGTFAEEGNNPAPKTRRRATTPSPLRQKRPAP